MAWYEDLTPCYYFGPDSQRKLKLIAVGWLEGSRPFPTGILQRDFIDQLIYLFAVQWHLLIVPGRHSCSICDPTAAANALAKIPELNFVHGFYNVSLGSANLLVPGDRKIFVAPSLILHYIHTHRYEPPAEFREAVLACPPM
jgi:hypothetical protein